MRFPTDGTPRISPVDQAEWKSFFNEYKNPINTLQEQFIIIDQNINKLIYKLYVLSEEEIQIVEGS